MTVLSLSLFLLALGCLSNLCAAVLPYDSPLEVRLLHKVGSNSSHLGDPVEAAIITPVFDGDNLILAAGATVSGAVEHIDRLGFGLRHNVARLDLHFTRLHLQDGTSLPIDARVTSVETARETVRTDGAVLGINPEANFSTGVSAIFTLSYLSQPAFRLPLLGFKFLAARSPDPEIAFPAGTELLLRLTKRVELKAPDRDAGIPLLTVAQISNVQTILDSLPAQQTDRGRNRPSDLVNILILGNQDEVTRAFKAAGWSVPETHGVLALYHMFHCAVERKSYSGLPMSNLKLNGYSPDISFEKSLDTFAKRHHVRLWRDAQSGAWLGAATEDVSYKMYKAHMTHATDSRIDNERAKIVNDLAFTGCLDRGVLIPRALLKPAQERGNAKSIQTDGDIAVVQLNSCHSPNVTAPDPQKPKPTRIIQAAVAVGVDIARSNPVSVAYALTRSLLDGSATRADQRIQSARVFTRASAISSAATAATPGIMAAR